MTSNSSKAAVSTLCLCTWAGTAMSSDHVVSVEAVLRTGQLVGYTVGSVTQMREVFAISAIAGNRLSGFAAVIETKGGGLSEPELLVPGPGPRLLSHVWGSASGGSPGMLLSENTVGSYEQVWFNPAVAIDDSGNVAVGARLLGAPIGFRGSLWQGTTARAVQGTAATSQLGYYWRYSGTPHLTAGGTLYWLGGLADTNSLLDGTSVSGFFTGLSGSTVLLGSTTVSGLPDDLATVDAVGRASSVSTNGSHKIVTARMDASSTEDGTVVRDGAGLAVGGTLLQESEAVGATGALTGESWNRFDHVATNSGGDWVVAARTTASSVSYATLVFNGEVMRRTGDAIDDETLGTSIVGVAINNDGDVAQVWKLADLGGEALLLNDLLLLRRGDAIDFDGDGFRDDHEIYELSRIGAIAVSDRTEGTLPSVFIHVIASIEDREDGTRYDALLRVEARPWGPTCTTIDYDDDGITTSNDFDLYIDLFGEEDPLADLDGNTFVDIADFLIFVELFSSCV